MILLVEEILHQLRLVVYSIIYRVMYIWGGAGFLPSTVSGFVIHREISLKWLLDFSFIHPHPKLGRKMMCRFSCPTLFVGGNYMLSRPPRLVTPKPSWVLKELAVYLGDKFDERLDRQKPSGRWSNFWRTNFAFFFGKIRWCNLSPTIITLKKNL